MVIKSYILNQYLSFTIHPYDATTKKLYKIFERYERVASNVYLMMKMEEKKKLHSYIL